jgi:hypothetical protein
MLRTIVILWLGLAVSTGWPQRAIAQDDIERTLSRAEALYFEARFDESILLAPVNETLRTQSGRLKERIATRFQLALANIGLNNTARRKLC